MDLSRMLREWIVVQHVTQDGPPDEMGDPSEVFAYSRHRGYVWQNSASEVTANSQVERESWTLAIAKTATDLTAGDRIYLDATLDVNGILVPGSGSGEVFDVAGPPWIARNARTGSVEYVQAELDRSSR